MNEQYTRHILAREAEHRPFDFDQIYNQIKDETFQSVIVPVDPLVARSMVSYYQQRYNGRVGTLTQDNIKHLKLLHAAIARSMTEDFDGKPIFCRMTNRSPKDGEPSGHLGELQRHYDEELGRLKATVKSECSDESNLQMVAASSAQLRSLRCTSADDVMNLLLSSERVFIDTLEAIECRQEGLKEDTNFDHTQWSTCLVLREWSDGIGGGEWEFRVFVHEGCITAVSQYNYYCIFPDLVKLNERELVKEIMEYWATVCDKILQGSYVIDLVKLSTDGSWKIIELNPFAKSTGAALFDWHSDRLLLTGARNTGGDNLPELRIRRERFEGLESYLQVVMLPLIHRVEDGPSHSGPWRSFLHVVGAGAKRLPACILF